MKGQPPIKDTPAVWTDLSAQGWAGSGDTAFYSLDQRALAKVQPVPGQSVFVWDEDEPGTVLGYIAVLEPVTVGNFKGWRAVPVPGTFYRGPKPEFMLDALGP